MPFRSSGSQSPKQDSPPSPPRKMPLGVSSVANIFLKMRHTQERVKSHHIESSSGVPQSQGDVTHGAVYEKGQLLQWTDTFICIGGVNVPMLLRATRGALMEEAESLGANALADEQWKCTICGPKHRPNGTFKVQIHYYALPVRSTIGDSHKPVALEQAKGVPGLMTILKRNE